MTCTVSFAMLTAHVAPKSRESRYALPGILLDPADGAVSTDGRCLLRVPWPDGADRPQEPILLDADSADFAARRCMSQRPYHRAELDPETMRLRGLRGEADIDKLRDASFPDHRQIEAEGGGAVFMLSVPVFQRLLRAADKLGVVRFVRIELAQSGPEKAARLQLQDEDGAEIATGLVMPCVSR